MEYYSAIKKNEVMPFTATWMNLKIIVLCEVSQRQISCIICEILKNGTNELIYISVQLFETPWTLARQAPLSMEFSRQEY